jgi:hypothetical protein
MRTLILLFAAAMVCCSSSCSLPSRDTADPAASSTDAFFMHVDSRVRDPHFFGGETDETLVEEGLSLLKRLGDRKFAEILRMRGQKDRSAVRLVLWKDIIEPAYPETAQVLRSSEKFDWPMKEANREFEKSTGETDVKGGDTWD